MYSSAGGAGASQYGGSVVPNDGLFVNPMRHGSSTPTSPSGSVSGESFYLHDPQEVIYNRVKDLFGDSDCSSSKEAPTLPHPNALTVKVDVHSSSSGAGSGSEESLSVSSSTSDSSAPVILRNHSKNNATNTHHNSHAPSVTNSSVSHDHDYEDIYLVREEAKMANAGKTKVGGGRSRSRDSGSHSRSASASSAHSTDIVVQYGNQLNNSNCNNNNNIVNQRNKLNESGGSRTRKNDIFGTNSSKKSNLSSRNNTLKNDTYESVCSPDDLAERKMNEQTGTTIHNGGLNNARLLKRVVSAPVSAMVQEARGEVLSLKTLIKYYQL